MNDLRQWSGVLVVTNDKRLALQLRETKPGISLPGRLTLFGGAFDPGEDAMTCARRELEEELTLSVPIEKLKPLNVYRKTKQIDGKNVLAHVFMVCDVEPAHLILCEGEAIYYCMPGQVLNHPKLSHITRLAIQDFLNI